MTNWMLLPEAEREELEEKAEEYIEVFRKSLGPMREYSIRRHEENMRRFLVDYLLHYEGGVRMENGLAYIDRFFNYYFIREVYNVNKESVRSMSASLKKFYRVMSKYNYVHPRVGDKVSRLIRKELPQWQAVRTVVKGLGKEAGCLPPEERDPEEDDPVLDDDFLD